MKRIEVKFKPETKKQMEQRRFRRRVHRLITFLVVIHALILIFLVLKHYDWLPKFEEKVVEIVEGKKEGPSNGNRDTQKRKGEKLINQTDVLHSGHSISADDQGLFQFNIDSYKGSVRSLYGTDDIGLFGIDVSHWQGKIDWSKDPVGANNQSIDFVIMKATQGAKYYDSQFENNWNGARKLGKKVGAYHFYIYSDDPITQANNYLNNVKFEQGMVRPIIDLELDCKNCDGPEISKEELVANVRRFLETVENKTGQRPIIYSYTSFYDKYLKEAFSDYDVWLARYTTEKPDEIPVLPGETESVDPTYIMWQFTDKEPIEGWGENVDASIIPKLFIDRVFIK